MTDITIPDAAVEAAAHAYFHSYYERGSSSIQAHRAAVEAAAPHIAAQALRDAADDPPLRLSGHSGISITRLRDRADRIEADHG